MTKETIMVTNNYSRYFILGFIFLALAVKIKEKCLWCSIVLIVGFLALEILGFVTLRKHRKKLKRQEDYGQKKDQ